ncbi:hypothetical protein FRB97_005129 [Tulasnella sp. 331]|nr:hypothetical protein FRB97_005129 [Tulasnella sp. 331]
MGSVTVLRLVPLLDGKEGYDILTRQWQVLLLLAHEGVMSHHSESGGYTARSVLSGTIALIDLSEMVTQPATYIPRDSSPFFVIQCKGLVDMFYMKAPTDSEEMEIRPPVTEDGTDRA